MMSPDSLLWPADRPLADPAAAAALLGGKAAALFRLRGLGLVVPDWVVLTTEAFRLVRALPAVDGVITEALARLDPTDPASCDQAAAAIRQAFARAPLPGPVAAALDAALARLCGPGRAGRAGKADRADSPGGLLAIRSSAVGEDGALHSFAGQLDSFLGVQGLRQAEDALRRCWASAWSPRALAYRAQAGLPREMAVAVILQELVQGPTAGVLFSADPETGDRETTVISAGYGLGEGVVQGRVDTDTYWVGRDGRVEQAVARKPFRLGLVAGGGAGEPGATTEQAVAEDEQRRPCLTVEEARTLARLGERLERELGAPQDVEWVLDARRRPVLLQSRPITTLAEGRRILWDNSNIVESFSGVTTPLTYSFARQAYETVYEQFCAVMGVDAGEIRRRRDVFRCMIGLVQGRVYYNLGSWYQVLALLPGFGFNKAFMEQMMGVSEAAQLSPEPSAAPGAGSWRRYTVELPQLLRLVGRLAFNLGTLGVRVKEFLRICAQADRSFRATDLAALDEPGLLALYRQLEQQLLWNWKAPIVNDFFAMVFFGLLRALVLRLLPGSPALVNDLLAGEGDLASTEPTRAVIRLALLVRADPVLARLFDEPCDAAVLQQIRQAPAAAPLRRELDRFLDRWGYRCMDELELESPTLKDDPTFVVAMIRNYLRLPTLDPQQMQAREREIRCSAEKRLAREVPGAWQPLVRLVLAQARLRIRDREQMRFCRTQVFGMVREILRALGRSLHRRGLIDGADDVFFLTLDELFGMVDGTAVSTDLRALVRLRRTEFERYRAGGAGPSSRFETRGMVHSGLNRFTRTRRSRSAAQSGDGVPARGESAAESAVLQGIGCSAGVVEGVVRVIRSPRDGLVLNGEILATERTDPGWVPLYPAVRGLLVERGSLLSHSAIVAREMGLPAVVGLQGLLAHVRDGDRVVLDGGAGTVTLLGVGR